MEEKISVNKLLDLSGKVAIVTGGGRGIGLSIAKRLAEAQAKVIVADFREKEATEAVTQITQAGGIAKAVIIDVSSEDDVKKMVEEATAAFGSLDILVNNAGIYPPKPLSEMNSLDFDKVISINLKGVYLCTKYASEAMKAKGQGGKIINITSIDAIHPSMIGLAHYDASKHGVWGFTKNVAIELAQHKIWVNAVAPGAIATPGVAEMQEPASDQAVDSTKAIEAFMNQIPMHRMGESDEIGKVVLFLASDMSSYMTGSQIVVDGGVLLS